MSSLKPSVPKKWLYWVCGLLWLGVGIMLCLRALFWIKEINTLFSWGLLFLMLFLSVLPGKFLLSRIAKRNLKRLDQQPERVCFFAFQPLRSYLIIALMIFMGVSLRRSSVPRLYLALVYALMGGALVSASALYFTHALKALRPSSSHH